MKRGKPLRASPQRAAERRRRREARRAEQDPRPEDVAREARRAARDQPASSLSAQDREAGRAWNTAACRRGCVMCKIDEVDRQTRQDFGWELSKIDGHHVVPKQDLKRWGLHALLWDLRNMLPLCRYHHFRHEQAVQRVPRELLPAPAWEFADAIGARFVLEDAAVYPLAL